MYRLLSVILVVIILGGCSEQSSPTGSSSENSNASLMDTSSSSQLSYGIGDAETTISLTVQMHNTLNQASVTYNELHTQKHELAQAVATVRKPYPEELSVVVVVGNRQDFDGHAVRILPRLYVDDRVVATFEHIYDADAKPGKHEFQVNLMDYLDEIPETLLVHTRAEVHLFMTTDPEEVTSDTPLGADSQSAEKMSNSLRINFEL